MFFAALLVAAAITYCEENPSTLRCTDAPVVESAVTDGQRASITALAADVRMGTGVYSREGNRDAWVLSPPGQRGDCEDRLLWVAQELEAIGLGASYRFVATDAGYAYDRSGRRVRHMHLVIVIEGQGERIVLDTRYSEPRSWSPYSGRDAYTPTAGLGGDWTPYS